jgi:hypothetical protein
VHGSTGCSCSAPASLQDQFHFDFVFFPLFEMNYGSFGAQIVSAVLAGEGVNRVWAQFPEARGLGHGFADPLLDLNLVHADRRVNHKGGHAGVLANGAFFLEGHVHVGQDDIEGLKTGSGVSSTAAIALPRAHRAEGCWRSECRSSELPERNSMIVPPKLDVLTSWMRVAGCGPGPGVAAFPLAERQ